MSKFMTHLGRLAGAGVVAAGLVPVFYLLALLVWQYVVHVQTRKWVALPANLAFTDHSTLYFTAVAPVLAFLPQLPPSWVTHEAAIWALERVHIGAPVALVGLLVSAVGIHMILRRNATLLMEERGREDRLRRVRLRQYGEVERIEPFIGPAGIAGNEAPERKREAA